jgi:hypothetical protein
MECYSLFQRLHHDNIIQNSSFTRNVLVQDGPLSALPSERSAERPTFRVIDFGRAATLDDYVEKDEWGRRLEDCEEEEEREVFRSRARRRFGRAKEAEDKCIRNELCMQDYGA